MELESLGRRVCSRENVLCPMVGMNTKEEGHRKVTIWDKSTYSRESKMTQLEEVTHQMGNRIQSLSVLGKLV